MSANPKIDLMALADLAQPRKLAMEIHRQLRQQYGEAPCKMPLREIAEAVGIVAIEEHDTAAFDGTLVIKGDNGAISIRRDQPRGRRNFTLGHELGHFLNPWHRRHGTQFQCTKTDMNAERGDASAFSKRPAAERIEVEANEFSATLLIPAPEFREKRARLGKDVELAHIQDLKETFDVSLEFMARTFVEMSREKLAVITTHRGVVRRMYLHKAFPYLGLRKGAAIPSASMTDHIIRSRRECTASGVAEIGTAVWLHEAKNVTALFEQVLVQRDGWAMTLLTIEEDEPDEEEDDSNWNRRNIRRFE